MPATAWGLHGNAPHDAGRPCHPSLSSQSGIAVQGEACNQLHSPHLPPLAACSILQARVQAHAERAAVYGQQDKHQGIAHQPQLPAACAAVVLRLNDCPNLQLAVDLPGRVPAPVQLHHPVEQWPGMLLDIF